MLLCDIGNTSANFWQDGRIWSIKASEFTKFQPTQKLFFISVNEKIHPQKSDLFIDLEPFCEFNTTYRGLGIDRAMACYSINTGLIVDAGSATTIDLMSNGVHLGGTILPGISASLKAYSEISPRLNKPLNSQVDLESLPQNTSEAISYGILKPLILLIKELANDKAVYFTGGDGAFLERFFENSIYDKNLVFSGMQKLINENKELKC